MASLQKRNPAERLLSTVEEIPRRIDDPVGKARAALYRGLILLSLGDTMESEEHLVGSSKSIEALLDPHDFYTTSAALAWLRLMRGKCTEGWKVIEHALDVEATGGQLNAVSGHSYRMYALPLLGMLGRVEEGYEHMRRRASELVEKNDNTRWRQSQLLGHSLFLQLEADDVGEEFDSNARAYRKLGLNTSRMPHTMRHGYVVMAYGHRRQVELASESERPALLRRLKKTLRAVKASSSWSSLALSHRYVLEASYFNFVGREDRARQRLKQAERHADASDNDWARFEIMLERARHAAKQGGLQSARDRLVRARDFAVERSWLGRAQRCGAMIDRLSSDG
jgi:hypothetical protein